MLQIVTVISGFIIPKIVLSYFGSTTNGLVSSICQFLSYITLVEGGISSVVMANIYRPLVNDNKEELSAVLVTSKAFFIKIGLISIAYSIGVAIIYPLLSKEGFSWLFVFSLTLILSINLIVQYLFSITYKTLLQADKKVYIVSFTQIAIVVLNICMASISVRIYPSIHLLKLLSGLLYVFQPIVYGYYVKKYYEIDWKAKPNNTLLKSRWDGFAINFAAFIHGCTDVTILTIFTNLATVSIYSVYSMITSGLKGLINAIISAIVPTVGQAYAKKNEHELNEKMDLYEYISFLLVFFCYSIAGLLITPFVQLYTQGITDADYYQPVFGVLIVISEALYLIKMPHQTLSYSANKFKEQTPHAYMEALINIILSLILVNKYGLIGVAIGTICGMLYRLIYHVYLTTKLIDGRHQIIFYKKMLWFTAFTLIGIVICNYISIGELSVINWLITACIDSLIFIILYLILSLLFFKKELKYIFTYIKK